MKQLLLLLSVALFISCNVVKKFTNKTHGATDSTATRSATVTQVKKVDSTAKETSQATEKQKIESGYKKTTTTVEEWFSDEFGSEPEQHAQPKDTAAQNPPALAQQPAKTGGGLFHRRTTTVQEEGFKNALNEALTTNEKTGKIQTNDSLSANQHEQGQKTTTQDTETNSKFSLSVLPFWLWLMLIVAVGVGLYVKVKFF